jgi:hypothetical protein
LLDHLDAGYRCHQVTQQAVQEPSDRALTGAERGGVVPGARDREYYLVDGGQHDVSDR